MMYPTEVISSLNRKKQLESLLRLLEQTLAHFFVDAPGQLIPDTLLPGIYNRPLLSVFKTKGIVELDRQRLGGFHERTTKNRKAHAELDAVYAQQQLNLLLELQTFLNGWFSENPMEEIAEERLATIRQILDILFMGTYQISRSALIWATKYALEATRVFPSTAAFSFSTSIAGDTTPPPYVESYIMEPLQKLARLQELFDQQKITTLPRFAIVFTLYSQAVENIRDHFGNLMDRERHLFISWVTCERIAVFIQQFFPAVGHLCDFVEFPAYHFVGPSRLFFNLLWQELPFSDADRAKLFVIKGEVEKQDESHKRFDPIEAVLDGSAGSYIGRHLFSNLIFSEKHSLRFASDATEPQFHITAMEMFTRLARNSEDYVEMFSEKVAQIKRLLATSNSTECHPTFIANADFIQGMVGQQVDRNPFTKKFHGQLGMHNTHASYYQHRQEFSLRELVQEGTYDAPQLRNSQREDKFRKLAETFARVTQHLGHQTYITFLRSWLEKYDRSPDLSRQRHRLEAIGMLCEQRSRNILNYHLP